MVDWIIYYKVGHSVFTDRFTGTQAELAVQLGKYEFIMEVRRQYD